MFHCLFKNVLFNFHIFVIFLAFFLLLISSFIPLWLGKILAIISTFLHLWKLTHTHTHTHTQNVWFILENDHVVLIKLFGLLGGILCVSLQAHWFLFDLLPIWYIHYESKIMKSLFHFGVHCSLQICQCLVYIVRYTEVVHICIYTFYISMCVDHFIFV